MKSVEGPMMEGYRYRRTHPITDLLGQIGTPRAVKLLERLAALKETPENSTMRRYAQYKLDELRKLKLRWPGKR